MEKLTHFDLMSQEEYTALRSDFLQFILIHKKHRFIPLGAHARLLFEDRETIQYQIQEMLKIENITEPLEIQEELDAYNPLIPDGQNLKATFMLEFPDPEMQEQLLSQLKQIEDSVWIQIGTDEKVFPFSNEDLNRVSMQKNASVHCLRFELTPKMCAALKKGDTMQAGINHPAMPVTLLVSKPVSTALAKDIHSFYLEN